ncbi:hypothetical protein [Butyrivibrio sp. AE2005]|uniref:hypothetical protein n=1 Tax=Butyrivibrio sp. AE2005 TaxID=1496722 RepID=UPI00047B8B00|nr:hypothetical protein [Butyrivibrio sp. AE2005]
MLIQMTFLVCKMLILLWFANNESTFFHELGHFLMARRYDKNVYGKIQLRYANVLLMIQKWGLLKIKNCEFIRNKKFGVKGRTDLSNNYICYTDSEIKKIAISGPNLGTLSILLFGIVLEYTFVLLKAESFTALFICVTLMLAAIWSYGKFFFYREEGTDYWIYKNPALFREKCRACYEEICMQQTAQTIRNNRRI